MDWKTILTCFVGLFFLFTICGGLLGCSIATPESGKHTGFITETGYRGLIWKTHYVKVVDSQQSFGENAQNYWYYGVDEHNLAIFEKAQGFQKNKTLITAQYDCSFFKFDWEISENCKLVEVG
jgi:hypothetical protein